MSAEELKQAVNLIKAGKKIEARVILEPIIVAEPQNIQAWVWEIETREHEAEKIKLMEACLLHNPDSNLIKKALAALKTQQEIPVSAVETKTPETLEAIRIDPFTEITEYQDEFIDSSTKKACPYCGELVDESAIECQACGRDLVVAEPEVGEEVNDKVKDEVENEVEEEVVIEKPKKKKWYRRTWIKILTFFLLMPVWCVIELSDPDARSGFKVMAGVLLVFFITLVSLFLYWFFTTNASRANLYNWYQYLSGQSTSSVPGEYVQVQGTIYNPGNSSFSLVELQAKVYDDNGDLLGTSTQYLDSKDLIPGTPTYFKMDVTSLLSPFQSGITNQQVLFYDDFSGKFNGWLENSGTEGETTYYEGQYRVTVSSANFDLWSNPQKSFTDSRVEVDTVRQDGPEGNRFGVQCRYADANNYYFAVISSDGYYGIGKVVDGEQTFLPKNGMQVTDTIFAGTAVNHIRFDCVGSRLTLYVNGDYVDAVDDNDLKVGDVGLLAGTFEEKGTQILFDNFAVFQP
ncbi:MAG TPA: hypothetical protein DIW44_08715 [Anaerolineaceae bacterium]|nr:hypothetical protein [Anaerolineaceae bacterium]